MKLYIGNIPFDAREEELHELFNEFGAIGTATVIVDPRKGRSRGFGFVEFLDPLHGKAAIAGMNGKEVGGRKLVVNEARSREGGGSGYRGNRGGFGGDRGGDREDRGDRGGHGRPGGSGGGGRPRF